MSPHVASGRIGDLPQIAGTDAEDPVGWTPLRHLLGVRAFGVNAWHGHAEGDLVIEEHDELPDRDGEGGHEELYLVLSGHARFVIGGEELDAPTGTVVVIPPNLRRVAHATTGATTIVSVGAPLGEAFSPSAWEHDAVANAGLA